MAYSQIPLLSGDKVANGLETDYRDALNVNMYAVEKQILGAAGYMLIYPGLILFATGEGLDRGGIYNERFADQYRISQEKLISVSEDGITNILGSVSGSEQVALPYSFNTQCIIADGKMFLYSPTGGFSEVTDPDLGQPIDAVWVDGYYFLTDGEYLYHTDIDDESSIDPLKFATAEFMPDPSIGLAKTQDNKVLVFGRYTLEYFVNVAQENFAFQRVQTRAQKIGIVATHAKTEVGGVFYITGGRKNDAVSVHIIGIGNSQKISTREIDKILKKYSEPDLIDMRMEGRVEDDITFILIHLPNETLCFNSGIAQKMGLDKAWSILKTDVEGNTPYRAINGVNDARISKWIYGDKFNSNIGQLDNDICTNYDAIVEWILYTPIIKLETMSIDELELETIPGHTTTEDATAAMSLSYDGLTYSPGYWIKYGDPRDYNQRFIVRTLGYINDWVTFKFSGATRSRMAFAIMKLTYS